MHIRIFLAFGDREYGKEKKSQGGVSGPRLVDRACLHVISCKSYLLHPEGDPQRPMIL